MSDGEAQEATLQTLSTLYAQECSHSGDGVATDETTFAYAICLASSHYADDLAMACRLLESLLSGGFEDTRSTLYFLARAHLGLHKHGEARRYIGLLLQEEPSNFQAQKLLDEIDQAGAKASVRGAAIVAGAAAAIAAGTFILARALKR